MDYRDELPEPIRLLTMTLDDYREKRIPLTSPGAPYGYVYRSGFMTFICWILIAVTAPFKALAFIGDHLIEMHGTVLAFMTALMFAGPLLSLFREGITGGKIIFVALSGLVMYRIMRFALMAFSLLLAVPTKPFAAVYDWAFQKNYECHPSFCMAHVLESFGIGVTGYRSSMSRVWESKKKFRRMGARPMTEAEHRRGVEPICRTYRREIKSVQELNIYKRLLEEEHRKKALEERNAQKADVQKTSQKKPERRKGKRHALSAGEAKKRTARPQTIKEGYIPRHGKA